jgi:hypothetical protein
MKLGRPRETCTSKRQDEKRRQWREASRRYYRENRGKVLRRARKNNKH